MGKTKSRKQLYLAFLLIWSLLQACQKDDSLDNDIRRFAKGLKQPSIGEAGTKRKTEAVEDHNQLVTYPGSKIKAGRLYLYSAGKTSGAMGGPGGAMKLCRSRLRGASIATKVDAYLEFEDFSLHTIPERLGASMSLPVYGLDSQKKIAQTWMLMLGDRLSGKAPKLLLSLSQADVFGTLQDDLKGYEGLFWSGYSPELEKQKVNCRNWTSEEDWGRVGGNHGAVHPFKMNSPFKVQFPWYDYRMSMSCDTRQNLLCVVYLNVE